MGDMCNIYTVIEETVKDLERRKIVLKDCEDWLRSKIKEPQTEELKKILKEV